MIALDAPPPFIAQRYRVLRELGRGGMGVVYVVEHLGTGDHLALKLLIDYAGASPETIERFKREARAPARIQSEHVVRVTDTDVAPELDGAPFMVMELLSGSDLEKMLEVRGRFTAEEVVGFLRQASIALDKAHALGITHRDLKPENLFLHRRENGDEILKVLDFGISKTSDANDIGAAALTRTGAMMGTPLYMSPEQVRGRTGEIGPAADAWAVGLIAYRLLTGRLYWDATTLAELMVQIIAEPMPPPSSKEPSLPAAFDAWFARSTDRDPRRRYARVGEQVAALAQALGVPLSPRIATGASPALPIGSSTLAAPPPRAAFPAMGAHTTTSALATSTVQAPPRAPSRAPLVAGLAVAVGLLGGLGAWKVTREAPAEPAAAGAAAAGAQEKKPAKPTKSIETPAPEEPTPVAPVAETPVAEMSVASVATRPSAAKVGVIASVAVKPIAPAKASASVKPSVSEAPAETKVAPPVAEPKKYDPAAP